jgi:Na+/H+ antiporter NhaD/arsenite permease-like protein
VLAGILLHEQLTHMLALPWRELIMVAAVSVSLGLTPQRLHVENVFNFAPMREVAILFVGIFATMLPALNYLSVHATDQAFGDSLRTPGQFYYYSGSLSAVLDSAPAYLAFYEAELAKLPPHVRAQDGTATSNPFRITYILNDPQLAWCLIAISLGSVFFGAMTYIGNGPNFMVKSIAEHAGAPVPSFFGYILCYALPILLPLLILIWGIFLWPHAGV